MQKINIIILLIELMLDVLLINTQLSENLYIKVDIHFYSLLIRLM